MRRTKARRFAGDGARMGEAYRRARQSAIAYRRVVPTGSPPSLDLERLDSAFEVAARHVQHPQSAKLARDVRIVLQDVLQAGVHGRIGTALL